MQDNVRLTDTQLIQKCEEWVGKLAKSGGKQWTLCVPPQTERDPDILFLELCKRLEKTNNTISSMNIVLENGRSYLMSVDAKKLDVAAALEAFGFGRNGLL